MKRWADLPPDERPCADDIAAALVVAARHFQAQPKLHEALARQNLRVLPGRVRMMAGWVIKRLFPDLKTACVARLVGQHTSELVESALIKPIYHPVKVGIGSCLEAFLVLRP